MHDFFIELVVKHRGMSLEIVKEIADGRIYTGRQAIEYNLVDKIGFEDDALKWLQEERKIDKSLKIKKYKLKSKLYFIDSILEDFENRISNIFSSRTMGLKSLYN